MKTKTTENSQNFAEALKQARANTGMSQQGMADRMLIPKRTIENWETGERIPPAYVQRFVLNELEQLANHRPIIDRETWEKAQEKMKAKAQAQEAPLGYEWKDGELVIDEEQAAKIREGVEEYLNGKA